MAFGDLQRREAPWDIRVYFGAMGNLMLTGAVLLTFMVFENSGREFALWQYILGYVSAAWTGFSGLSGFWRFVTTSAKPATAAVLAFFSVFASLLFGGVFGYAGITMLASALR